MNKSNDESQLERDLNAVTQARDELCVKIHLAKADARDAWDKLEKRWHAISDELKLVSAHTKQPAKQISGATRDLINELAASYRHIRAEIESSAH